MAVADAARPDGTVHIYAHNQNPQALRGEIAQMLGTTIDNVVVHAYAGPGHYGRSNGGNAGGEDEAVILSKAVGKPVRVQWMRADDFQWSTQMPAAFSDVEIGLDANGKIVGLPNRPLHARRAGRSAGRRGASPVLPTMPAPAVDAPAGTVASTINRNADPWVYDRVANLLGTWPRHVPGRSASFADSPIGLRDHSMRTPSQFQQNFPRELAISEAAALAGADAIQFRLDHAKEERVIGVLKAVREASGWETRPSPRPNPVSTGDAVVRGRGVSVMFRSGTYWACVCEIAVTPSTGVIKVEKYTIAVDPGIVVNPMQMKRQVEGGAIMGISAALLEEATFDESGITNRDWRTYPILKMADIPEIKVVLLNRPEVGAYGGGSEAANALAAPAIAAALFDATGKIARRLPLKPEYVQALLKA